MIALDTNVISKLLLPEPAAAVTNWLAEQHLKLNGERDEQPTAFGVDGFAIAPFVRTSALPA